MILHIEIQNEVQSRIRGEIVFEDNFEQPYEIDSLALADIVPQDDLTIKEIKGETEHGVTCSPFVHKDEEDPKRKFHIVSDGEGGCVILPASKQYHLISPTSWEENGEIVSQEDFFHPGTREAVLITKAHGNRPETTTIFQGQDSTKSRRSTSFGLMVTASEWECHINHLTDELGK